MIVCYNEGETMLDGRRRKAVQDGKRQGAEATG